MFITATATALALDLTPELQVNTSLETYFLSPKITEVSEIFHTSSDGIDFIILPKPSPLEAKLYSYLELEDNWDGYGAIAPDRKIISSAQKLLNEIHPLNSELISSPRLMLSADSEVGIYWNLKELYVELSIDEEGFFSYLINDKANNNISGEDDLHIKEGIPYEVLSYLQKRADQLEVA